MPHPFHLAINVGDLDTARAFYGGVLECGEGRSTDTWVDFDFFGHQLSLHLGPILETQTTGKVGDTLVPMPHFGFVLPLTEWEKLAARLTAQDVDFIIPPSRRFEGQPGAQNTMFFRDPFGNPIEVKAMADPGALFADTP